MSKSTFIRFLMVLGAIALLGLGAVLVGVIQLNRRDSGLVIETDGTLPIQLQPVSQVEPLKAPEIDPAIPNELKPCLPEAVNQVTLLAQKKRQGESLYLLRILGGDSSSEPLISLKGGECKVLNPIINESDMPLSRVVDRQTAEEIAVLRFQKIIAEEGGLAKFETGLAEHAHASQGTIWMPSEYYSALQKLKVKIPKNVKPTDKVPSPEGFRDAPSP